MRDAVNTKIVLSARKDSLWLDTFHKLKRIGFEIPYWVGAEAQNEKVDGCFFHEVVDAYELKNLYQVDHKIFDISNLTLEEYYNYLKILDRADNVGGYSFSQRDRLLKDQLSYWFSVFSNIKPNLVVFSNLPHLIYDYPMYLIARYMGVETLIFNVTPYEGWHFITSSLSSSKDSNLVKCMPHDADKISSFSEVAVEPYEGKKYSVPYYMRNQFQHDKKNKLLSVTKRVMRLMLVRLRFSKEKLVMRGTWRHNFFDFIGVKSNIANAFYRLLLRGFKRRLKERYLKSSISLNELRKIKNYIYVPLHYQPEATTAPLGGFFSDQIYMLEKLRSTLPSNIALVVKEHYSQFSGALDGYRGRYLEYWDKINELENTHVVPLECDPKGLIVDSLGVATVTGTSGWEAIQYGKKCIVFGEPWYSSYPGVVHYDEDFERNLLNVINDSTLENLTNSFLSQFCKSLIKGDIHSYSNSEISVKSDLLFEIIRKYVEK